VTAPEYFVPTVAAARTDLMSAYDRLQADPSNASARDDVRVCRTRFMYTIVTAMR
jgi:hypothetical protein